jgi:hypothetical protein
LEEGSAVAEVVKAEGSTVMVKMGLKQVID